MQHPGIHLEEGVFTHDQRYVALSRPTNSNNIYIAIDLSLVTTTAPATDNIIYHEILLTSPQATLAEKTITTT